MSFRRPQFSIRTLLWLTLVVAAFVGGIAFEKERRRRADNQELPTSQDYFGELPTGIKPKHIRP